MTSSGMKLFDRSLCFGGMKIQWLMGLGLFCLVFGLGLIHATKGIDLTDEGMYLSTAMRYALGDRPFVDEIMNATRPFDVLVSPLFRVFPGLTLLEMRVIGLGLHLVTFLLLALFLLRFAPPAVVLVPCAVGFVASNPFDIYSPSYNTLCSDFSLLALTLWLGSLVAKTGIVRMALSSLGGVICALAVSSYSSFLLILCVPLATGFASLLSLNRRRPQFFSSIVFIGACLACLSVAAGVLAWAGLFHDLVDGFRVAILTQKSVTGSLIDRPLGWIQELLKLSKYSLVLLSGVVLIVFALLKEAEGTGRSWGFQVFGWAVVCAAVAIITRRTDGIFWFYKFMFSYAALLAVAGLCFDIWSGSGDEYELSWRWVLYGGIAWGLFSSAIFGVSSGGGLRNSLLGFAPLFILGVIASFRALALYVRRINREAGRRLMQPLIILMVPVFFLVASMKYSYGNVYREAGVELLTEKFNHPRLKGIHSTAQKVRALEGLLDYLHQRIKPGDYLLAYNYVPMLYFLTQTRPAYRATWARDDWPVSLRQDMVDYMQDRNRVPEYCVRMVAWPEGHWRTPMPYKEDSPLDIFVSLNFYLEKTFYPFEVWRRGPGPKYRLYSNLRPAFEASFLVWNGPETVSTALLSETSPPLVLQGRSGEFKFSRVKYEDHVAVRITPEQDIQIPQWDVQFGYTLNRNGFELQVRPGQKLAFMLSARLSDVSHVSSSLFIQDRTEEWERNAVSIAKRTWQEYIVTKTIRDRFSEILLGIAWQPLNKDQWLEIRNVRVFVLD
jgi:hypothetical protein